MRIIPAYPDASANAPCTRTTVGLVDILSLLLRVRTVCEFRPSNLRRHHLNARFLISNRSARGVHRCVLFSLGDVLPPFSRAPRYQCLTGVLAGSPEGDTG